jgi:hypothetical protein
MRDVTAVNEKYFKQAVEQMNESELFPVKIQLGSELKESTLKVFMENVEAVPVEKETEIGPKIVEMYNFIFDEAYQIPEGIFDEEVVMEEVKMEDAVDPSVEVAAPVGGTVEAVVKVKKVKAPKEPKEPKEPKAPKEKKEHTPLAEKGEYGFRKGSKCDLFINAVKENPGITMKEVQELPWNDNKATYNGTLSKMKKEGKMKTENGKIFLV